MEPRHLWPGLEDTAPMLTGKADPRMACSQFSFRCSSARLPTWGVGAEEEEERAPPNTHLNAFPFPHDNTA